jgi:adenylate cyclase class 2
MSSGINQETEIKLRVESAAAGRRLLKRAGFRVAVRRVFESNLVFDTQDRHLLARRCLLRIRRVGKRAILTFKGAPVPGPHKSREEIETELTHPEALAEILPRLGFEPVFRYEKYRTEFRRGKGGGVATLDETPIGVFLELEGPSDWIDRTARVLGSGVGDYILASYGTLFLDFCREKGLKVRDMIFQSGNTRQVSDSVAR